MIELGKTTDAPAASADIKDTTDQTFMADVVEASQQRPVIVDFWAPWCGPCKTLGPLLEQEVAAAKGAVAMVKLNVDEHQMVASQMRVQSIPTVYAFYQGQPVDAFQGAVAPMKVKEFVKKLVDMAGGAGGGLEDALEQAEQMLEDGEHKDAGEVFAAVLGQEPENPRAIGGIAKALLAMGQLDAAKEALATAPESAKDDPAIASARAAIELHEMSQEAGEVAELRARLAENENDHQARFDLALALVAKNDAAAAVDELLELFRRDREWNDGAAKAQLFKLFDTLGPKDPVAAKGRRRLSSMIFA